MRSKYFIYLFLMISTLIGKEIIAVSNISQQGLTSFQAKQFFNRLEAELVNMGGYVVTSRQEVDKILKEQKFQKAGCTDQQCAAEIGRMLNADKMLLSEVLYEKSSKSISITLKLVDVETAQITTAVPKFKDKITNPISPSVLDDISDYLVELYRQDNAGQFSGDFFGSQANQPIQKEQGSLSVTSTPVGAKVFLKNDPQGLTPVTIKSIDEGEYKLILTFEGYERLAKRITIIADSLVEVNESLLPLTGTLNIISTPSNADVYLNEEFKGKSPITLEFLEIGNYFVKIKKENYQDYSKKIKVDSNHETRLPAFLSPLPASLSIFSTPSQSEVYIDGTSVGTTDPSGVLVLKKNPGNYKIEIKKKRYFSEHKNIELKANEDLDLEFSLEPRPEGTSEDPNAGWLSVNGKPSDSYIDLDGQIYKTQYRSTTDKFNNNYQISEKYIELSRGTYQYKFYREGYKSILGKFHIAAGKHTKLNLMLKPYNKKNALLYAMLFPGLGHHYIEKRERASFFMGLEAISILGTSAMIIQYSNTVDEFNNAKIDYLAATNPNEISEKYTIYENLAVIKKEYLITATALGGISVAIWAWNIFDLNKSFPKSLDSSITIGMNSQGYLEASIAF